MFNYVGSSTAVFAYMDCSFEWVELHFQCSSNLIIWILSFVTFIVSNQWNSCYRPGFGKLYPAGYIWPPDCSGMVCKLRLVFAFLNGWKNLKEV